MTLKMFRSTMTEIGTPTSHRTSDLIMTSCQGIEGFVLTAASGRFRFVKINA
jgi:hypothetical protein